MNHEVKVRRYLTAVDEILHEGGPVAETPVKRGAVCMVIENPFAGRYVEDVQSFMEDLKPFGRAMAVKLVDALGGDPSVVEGYGKGSIVGVNGEIEHGALWHAPGGYAMRDVLGGAKAIVPSTKKVGAAGTRIDIPITHKDASYVRSHFDAIEIGVPDAPRPNELVFVLAMTTGPRIHHRMGGLDVSEISVGDGQR